MPKCYIKDYPRPQFVRGGWQSLNGVWDFAFDDGDAGEKERWYEDFPPCRVIEVPFAYETAASGIGDEAFHPVVWYRRALPPAPPGERAVLHFEGCDYAASVWVNGRLAGTHRGGYTRFSFDITELLADGGSGGGGSGENVLVVRAADSDSLLQPRGKQRWRRESFGCWYVQTTGIWKTVWLEHRPPCCIEKAKMTPVLGEGALDIDWEVSPACREHLGGGLELAADISFEGAHVQSVSCAVREFHGRLRAGVRADGAMLWGLRQWTPEDPALYDIEFTLRRGGAPIDSVKSYFGMRDIKIADGQILLNGRPLYQRLVLDQGYWPQSHLTPPGEDALANDVAKIKQLGFNGVRMHQKIEDERFYSMCDAAGLLAWCEMPSAYAYGDAMAEAFAGEWLAAVEQHYSHPCVIAWVPFNESWGIPGVAASREQQHFTQAIYHLTKSIDPMRPVMTNDGWEHTVSDILTLHDYEASPEALLRRYRSKEGLLGGGGFCNGDKAAFAGGFGYAGQPVIISEYGGIAFASGAVGGAWGYGAGAESEADFLERLCAMAAAIRQLPYVRGYCYTQLTDVQQEVNGLMDAGRNFKAGCAAIREINEI